LHRLARPGSPFEHPGWSGAWARHFVPDGDRECVAVRDGAGGLIGFAPLYRRTRRWAGVSMTEVRPLGTGRRDGLTEVVQVLARPESTREVLRAVVRHVEGLAGWTWFQLSLAPGQGWLVPQWLERPDEAMILHRAARPCVLMPHPPADPSALKRNVRESVRRSRNRARGVGGLSTRVLTGPDEVAGALAGLVGLHRERSLMAGKVEHADLLDHRAERDFLADAVRSLAEERLARIHVAELDGRMVAGQLVLSAGTTDYNSVSGLDPVHWELGLNTLLIFEAMSTAAELRRRALNLSTGPDTAKTRWSETVEVYHDFAIVRGDRRSRWLYAGYAHLSLALTHHEARRRHRVRATPAGRTGAAGGSGSRSAASGAGAPAGPEHQEER
jgi:CelD/BcsL family acetyltransferase involved in cellulose biosynthesis